MVIEGRCQSSMYKGLGSSPKTGRKKKKGILRKKHRKSIRFLYSKSEAEEKRIPGLLRS